MGDATPSLDAELPWPDDAVEVGRIVDAWGVKGWLRVQPFAADPQALFSSRRWFLQSATGQQIARPGGAASPRQGCLKISAVKEHGDGVVAQAHGVCDRNQAEALRGARIFIARSSFPTAGQDEFYWVDLIGMDVVNRQGEPLGSVLGLIDTGPHSVLRVLPDGCSSADAGPDAERLIPFVAAYVDSVDTPGRRITVDWGLDY